MFISGVFQTRCGWRNDLQTELGEPLDKGKLFRDQISCYVLQLHSLKEQSLQEGGLLG